MKENTMKKWLYENDKENTVRYVLGEIKEPYIDDNKTMACIGINPSFAEPNKLDNTVNFVKKKIIKENYDNWIMFNIYPKRSTIFNNLENDKDIIIFVKNIEIIIYWIKTLNIKNIWCAWGSLIKKRKYLFESLEYIIDKIEQNRYINNIKFLRADYKISEKNHPHHPLYLPKESNLIEFDIKQYIKNNGK